MDNNSDNEGSMKDFTCTREEADALLDVSPEKSKNDHRQVTHSSPTAASEAAAAAKLH